MAPPLSTPPAGTRPRVDAYTRRPSRDEHLSVRTRPQQRQRCQSLAGRHRWTQAATDLDHPGGSGRHRPGRRAAVADARTGRFGVLLVRQAGQLGRRVADIAVFLDELDIAGVVLQPAPAAPTGPLTGQPLAAAADHATTARRRPASAHCSDRAATHGTGHLQVRGMTAAAPIAAPPPHPWAGRRTGRGEDGRGPA